MDLDLHLIAINYCRTSTGLRLVEDLELVIEVAGRRCEVAQRQVLHVEPLRLVPPFEGDVRVGMLAVMDCASLGSSLSVRGFTRVGGALSAVASPESNCM